MNGLDVVFPVLCVRASQASRAVDLKQEISAALDNRAGDALARAIRAQAVLLRWNRSCEREYEKDQRGERRSRVLQHRILVLLQPQGRGRPWSRGAQYRANSFR